MATYTEVLKAIYDPRKVPFKNFVQVGIGTDTWEYKAGELFGVDNVFELISLRVELTTDATVANRVITVKLLPDGKYVNQTAVGDNIAASSAETTYIAKVGFESAAASANFLGISDKSWVIWGDGKIQVTVANGVAGDVVDVRCQLRWLNLELGMATPFGYRWDR